MKIILLMLLICFSTVSKAQEWIKISDLNFSGPGFNDFPRLRPDSVSNLPIQTGKFKIQTPPNCDDFTVYDLYLWSGERSYSAVFNGNSRTQQGWLEYNFSSPNEFKVDWVGIKQENPYPYPCRVLILGLKEDSEPPPPPPSQNPEERHCSKAAFLLKYDYDTQVEMTAVLAPQPPDQPFCLVYIRFRNLSLYRDWLNKRREEGKSDVVEVLQDENVRIELEHAVL